jgi:hypothetical protein
MHDPQRIGSAFSSQCQPHPFLPKPCIQAKSFTLRILCRDWDNSGFCQHGHLANLVELFSSLTLDAFHNFERNKFFALLAFRGNVDDPSGSIPQIVVDTSARTAPALRKLRNR